jgi:thiol-disulfide isomerase/thioredoxin
MRILSLILLAFIALQLSGQSSSSINKPTSYEAYLKAESKKYVGKKYPDFVVKGPDLFVLSNNDLTNKVVFINFWSEHCSPCIAEMDGLNKLFDKLKDNDNFLFVSFSNDSDTTISRLAKKLHIKYKVLSLEKEEYYRLNYKNGIPTSFILDKKGIIKYFRLGGPAEIDIASKMLMTEVYPQIMELLKQ